MRRLSLLLAAMIVLCAGSIASAHPQSMLHTHAQGFEAGLFHPLLGIDHLLAMVMVGIVAARLSGRAVWLAPAAFVSFMVLGGMAGMAGVPFPGIETAIAVSVIVLGLSAARQKSISLGAMLVVCAAFGFVHGHAHGAEMPSLAQPAPVWPGIRAGHGRAARRGNSRATRLVADCFASAHASLGRRGRCSDRSPAPAVIRRRTRICLALSRSTGKNLLRQGTGLMPQIFHPSMNTIARMSIFVRWELWLRYF